MVKELTETTEEEIVTIKKIEGGMALTRRLGELGIYEGAKITIIKNDSTGPLIVRVLRSRIALGRGEAKKIFVD